MGESGKIILDCNNQGWYDYDRNKSKVLQMSSLLPICQAEGLKINNEIQGLFDDLDRKMERIRELDKIRDDLQYEDYCHENHSRSKYVMWKLLQVSRDRLAREIVKHQKRDKGY
jgi:hypothetical protein